MYKNVLASFMATVTTLSMPTVAQEVSDTDAKENTAMSPKQMS